MASLFESQTLANWHAHAKYMAQTFTPSISHILTSAKMSLRLFNPGGAMSALQVTIQDTDVDGKPNGTVLATGTAPITGLTYGDNVITPVTFAVTPTLDAGTAYAIVLYNPDWTDAPDYKWVHWYGAFTVPSNYTGGAAWKKDEIGGAWEAAYTQPSVPWVMDFWFEEYGDSLGDPVPTPAPTGDLSRPQSYDAELVYDEDAETWDTDEDINKLSGGRYRTMLFTVCNYQIYFLEVD